MQRFTDDAARAAADVTEQRARADAGHEQASDARAAHAAMIAELAAARQCVEDERAHTQIRLTDQRAGYEDRLTELRAEIDKTRGAEPAARQPPRSSTLNREGSLGITRYGPPSRRCHRDGWSVINTGRHPDSR